MTASYIALHQSGTLNKRQRRGHSLLSNCTLCPRECGVNRLENEIGFCGTGKLVRVASYGPHFGEEQPLVGDHGSGTIFFSGCNLNCCFCQNYDISHHPETGVEMDSPRLAAIMLGLQQRGCHNINLVTPSHVVPQILEALTVAADKGLHIPIVYNSSGYDNPESLELLSSVIDIYMPDFKFWTTESAARYIGVRDYPEKARETLQTMHNQVGDLEVDQNGVATSGMIIRHLLMPGLHDETAEILGFIAHSLSTNSYINIMDQYRPCGDVHGFPELCRGIRREELQNAVEVAQELGLTRIDHICSP